LPKYYKLIADNRRARHDFEIVEVYRAGVVLKGSEVKSVRLGRVNLRESFARADGGEIWIHGMHISPYEKSRAEDFNPARPRKLLLNQRELNRLIGYSNQKGLALVPLKIYFERDWAKIDIAVARAKKRYDKRASIREREEKREISKRLKESKKK